MEDGVCDIGPGRNGSHPDEPIPVWLGYSQCSWPGPYPQWRRNDFQVGGGGQGHRQDFFYWGWSPKTTYPQIQVPPRIWDTLF